MAIQPSQKPALALERVDYLLKRKGYDKHRSKVILVGIRGYYLDTIGEKGKNDYGHYDDFLAWVWPTGYATFNANTDPSRIGWNPNAGRYMARLRTGIWDFVMRKHKNSYEAFGQGENKVAVDRVNEKNMVMDVTTGLFGINIHKGGENSTSSEGCITLPADQWSEFKSLGYSLLKSRNQKSFKFILFDEEQERKYQS